MKRQRSYLRRRSPDRPVWEDLELRLSYREANPDDEIVSLFPGCSRSAEVPHPGGYTLLSRKYTDANEVHHIASCIGGTPRWDVTTNLIHLSPITHRWAERYPADGAVCCLLAKKRKGELDWQELDRITHVNVRGWVETRTLQFAWVEPLRRELLQ